ncbi:MAG: hypothetical protein BZ138_07275 [Methanosphaera sp. rholeuAM270]|nr:MAG: hypothetical protein BZ138_07275 [Methanosphaera sp. rholeuAM270]
MNEAEYNKRIAEIEEHEMEMIDQYPTEIKNSEKMSSDDIDDMLAKVEEVKEPDEYEKVEKKEQAEKQEFKDENDKLKKMPSLREFMKTEEFLRLGTKARIPISLDLNGYEVKVFVRALSRNEIQACRIQAQNTDDDMDFLAVLKACTDEDGVPYDRETLDQLGYARIRDISEAIGIASGENPASLESNIRKKVIDNFLQKIEDET